MDTRRIERERRDGRDRAIGEVGPRIGTDGDDIGNDQQQQDRDVVAA